MVKGSSFNREVPQYSYPLGLMYIASYLRLSQPGHEIELLDLRCHKHPYDLLKKRLQAWDPQIVAISALTCEAESLHIIASIVKERNGETVVVVGGPHISACTNDVTEDLNIDVLAIGESESTFAEFISRVSKGASIEGIPGTATVFDPV